MWEDKQLHRELLLWSQCSQLTASRQSRPERQNQVQERANQNKSSETTQAVAQNIS